MTLKEETPTWVACLTPPGVGAIATIAVHGPSAWEMAQVLFRSSLPEKPEHDHFWLGKLGQDLADEVVLAVKRLEPTPWIEVHAHGGRETVRLVMEAFQSRGARVTTWQSLEHETAGSPICALAVVELAKALTVRTAAILLDQYHGALDRALESIRKCLETGDVEQAKILQEALERNATIGKHLTTPWRVVVAGPPNVGKSSLVNALAGYRRSIVSPTPGTTRDVVSTLIAVDGWPIELCDTAGIRNEVSDLENQGIERARVEASTADLCLWVMDASAAPVWPDASLPSVLHVVNKIDLPAAWDVTKAGEAVAVSALTGEGLKELCDKIALRLVPQTPSAREAVPFEDAGHGIFPSITPKSKEALLEWFKKRIK